MTIKIFIIFYSRYGNTMQMAEAIAEGVRSVEGCRAELRRTAELAPQEVIQRDERWAKMKEHLEKTYPLVKTSDLKEADGAIFGSPTRFGNMASSLKDFWDQTSGIWMEGGLIGKVGGCFTGSATMHGGQETTILTMWIPMIHHGMLISGVPYSEQVLMTTRDGGSPYGPSTVAGPMSDKPPTENDMVIARALGKRVAQLSVKLRS
ncbi:MAG: NAD(P)H:quinone oxidoreductase [ANME-2 cluster archaeon]|nr:NAD(P)H:quinone oxidoreductase [ANME-2 cluster archaeon]